MRTKIKFTALIFAVLLLMSGCKKPEQTPEDTSASSFPEQTVSAVQTTAPVNAAEKSGKKIKPLSNSSRNGYYEDKDFSLTAELITLQSSLYYPDIVTDMGANPKLFVVTALVRVRNMAYEEKSFDCSEISITAGGAELYLYSSDFDNMKDIRSGKTESAEMRFLCTLEQAAAIDGMSYNGKELDTGSKFIPESFEDIIDVQSADDVMDYFYRQYVIHGASDYYTLLATPTSYEMHHVRGIHDGEKNYLAVTFTGYNRSDYAQLIEPKAFTITCSKGKGTPTERAEPLYISTDEKLMYEPEEADIHLDRISTLYKIPDFICTHPEKETEFTIVYDIRDNTQMNFFSFNGSHKDEPYYSSIEVMLGFEKDIWEDE